MQGCVLTCALDGTVKVWQFVPDATRENGAKIDPTPVYVHPPEDEGVPGQNSQARSLRTWLVQQLGSAPLHRACEDSLRWNKK